MEKKVYIMPRRSGKSSIAAYELLKDPKNTLILCINNMFKESLISQHIEIKDASRNIRTVSEPLRGLKYKKVIIDEYLMCNVKQLEELSTYLPFICEEVICLSTIHRVINKKYFDFVKALKHTEGSLRSSEVAAFIHEEVISLGNETSEVVSQLEYLYYNFITDVDTDLIFKSAPPTIERERHEVDLFKL